MAGFAFPRHAIPWLAFLALLPFFIVLYASSSLRKSVLYGWIWGVSFFTVLLPWIPGVMMEFGHQDRWTSLAVHLLLVGFLGFYPALFAGLFCFLNKHLAEFSLFVIPPLWTSVEWLRTYAPMGGFPWGQLGYALVPYLGYMQSASLAGIYGPTFLAVLANLLVFFCLRWKDWSRGLRFGWLLICFLFFGCWVYGLSLLHSAPITLKDGQAPAVVVLQGNIAFENDLTQAKYVFQGFYRDQTRKAFQSGVGLVVWPESPTPYSFGNDTAYAEKLRSLASEGKGFLLFNDIVDTREAGSTKYYNAALLLGPDGRLRGEYHKIKLVPFGEYVPYTEWLGFAEALTREVGAFSPGASPGVMPLASFQAGVFICFETIFPSVIRNLSIGGADLLINLSNDSWYGPTSAPWQHLQMAVVRAIENRRPLLRAANSGISALISPWGEIQVQTPLFKQTNLSITVPLPSTDSLYVQWGDWFPLLCVMIVVTGLSVAGWRAVHPV